jgi:hypothetical protein
MKQLNITRRSDEEITPGYYKHFKGGLYEVIGFISDGSFDDIVNEVAYRKIGGTQLFQQKIERFEEVVLPFTRRFERLPSIGDEILIDEGHYKEMPKLEIYLVRYEVNEEGDFTVATVWANRKKEITPYYNRVINLLETKIILNDTHR